MKIHLTSIKTYHFWKQDCLCRNGFVLCLQIFAQCPVSLILYIKKGTALTIPYSGEPERPRRSNYPFNVASSAKKHLLASVKVQSSYLCLHILYTLFWKNLQVIFIKCSFKIQELGLIKCLSFGGARNRLFFSVIKRGGWLQTGLKVSLLKLAHRR